MTHKMSDSSPVLVLPGETITPPDSASQTLTLGPGVRLLPPSTLLATQAGILHTTTPSSDGKKRSKPSAVWLDTLGRGGRYAPHVGDVVVATVHHSSADTYHCLLSDFTPPAQLPQLSFEGATKKTRPILASGALVYARVSRADAWSDAVELECVDSASGKSMGFGPLKDGMVFGVSVSFARRLMMGAKRGGVVLLDEIGERVRFEVAVGCNGVVWVDSASVRDTLAVGRCLVETDERGLDVDAQRKLVRKLVKTA